MFYTYVLRCCDGQLYVGSAVDLRKRLAQHRARQVDATADRLPMRLEYYEACRSELKHDYARNSSRPDSGGHT
jgi:predicted GIY-YIG superfamily endonuclease